VRCHSCCLYCLKYVIKTCYEDIISLFFFLDDEQLLEPVNDSNIYSSERGNTVVIPCIAKNPAVKLELYRVLTPAIYKLVSASETMLQSFTNCTVSHCHILQILTYKGLV